MQRPALLKQPNVYIIHIAPQKVLIKLYTANGVETAVYWKCSTHHTLSPWTDGGEWHGGAGGGLAGGGLASERFDLKTALI